MALQQVLLLPQKMAAEAAVTEEAAVAEGQWSSLVPALVQVRGLEYSRVKSQISSALLKLSDD